MADRVSGHYLQVRGNKAWGTVELVQSINKFWPELLSVITSVSEVP